MVNAVGFFFGFAGFADYYLQGTFRVVAIDLVASWGLAVNAFGDVLRSIAKGEVFALVEDVTFTFPEAFVLELLAVFDDTALEVIDIFEALVLHIGAEVFAADVACAIGINWLVFREFVDLGLNVAESLDVWG